MDVWWSKFAASTDRRTRRARCSYCKYNGTGSVSQPSQGTKSHAVDLLITLPCFTFVSVYYHHDFFLLFFLYIFSLYPLLFDVKYYSYHLISDSIISALQWSVVESMASIDIVSKLDVTSFDVHVEITRKSVTSNDCKEESALQRFLCGKRAL